MRKSDDPPSRFGGERGLPDPDAPASAEELRAAARLRAALESDPRAHSADGPSPELALAESLRAAASPKELDPSRHQQILAGALAARPGKVRSLAFARIASAAALAAAFALLVGQLSRSTQTSPMASPAQFSAGPAVAMSRSTTALFPDGIPVTGGTSERVDRIAFARAQDLRENRFARWGVR